MPLSFGQFFVRGLVLFFVPQLLLSADAQNSISNHVLSPIANLRQLIRDSGYIFDGTVVSVTSVGQTEASANGPDCGMQVSATARANASYYFYTGPVNWASPAQLEGRGDAFP